MSITIKISLGEFIDKMVILEIKADKINDKEKLTNIRNELEMLQDVWNASGHSGSNIDQEILELRKANEMLWDIEDEIRKKEANKNFDKEFIELARQVYITNDKRASIKHSINEKLGSALREEKSYSDYENNME